VNTLIAVLLEEGEDAKTVDAFIAANKNTQQPATPANAGVSAPQQTSASAGVSQFSATAAKAGVPHVGRVFVSPLAKRMANANHIDLSKVVGTGPHGRITKSDVEIAIKSGGVTPRAGAPAPVAAPAAAKPLPSVAAPVGLNLGDRPEQRVPMSRLRARIAERLVQSQSTNAILTTFNEVNMAPVMEMRKKFQEKFEKEHGVKLGFMSFFAKAAANALTKHGIVNASVDGNDVIYHGYADISIAVATEKGLVTPVLRNVENMSFADIEAAIAGYAKQAREGGLKLEDLQGGTFTITNGGTFGSLMSTPIVNPPQSAILGMHAIKERPIAENGQVVIAPMMYIALSYDHRIIDGKDAVLFLVDIKNQLENPHRMLLGL
jgi:2-oxoglutarate dehydrogenase E2 component (dihydrolipoamide succinyltransferase)